MIKHLVMWKMKEQDKAQKEKDCEIIKEALLNLKDKINEIKDIRVGINSDEASEENYDVVLDSEFENFSTLDIYQRHPAHQEVVKIVKKLVKERVAIDYEIR